MASPKAAAAALFLLTVASSAAASGIKFDITEVLGELPDFSTFNSLLSQTKLAADINQHQTVTVLAVDNSAVSALTSLPPDTLRKVLAMQVILDYYDPVKLELGVKKKTALLPTLYQKIGAANDLMGFLNFTEGANGQMEFGSAEPGTPRTTRLMEVVAARPYNLSVMQVNAPVIPPSVGAPPGTVAATATLVPPNDPELSGAVVENEDEDPDVTDDADDGAPDASPTSSGTRVAVSASVGVAGLVLILLMLL